MANPGTASAGQIQALQRRAGNRAVQQLLERRAMPVLQREDDDEIAKQGGNALASALKMFSDSLGGRKVEDLPEAAASVTPATDYQPAADAWRKFLDALGKLVAEQSALPPIPASDELIAAAQELRRAGAKSERRLRRLRRTLKTARKTKKVPIVSAITRAAWRKAGKKHEKAALQKHVRTTKFLELFSAYSEANKQQIKATAAGQAYVAAQNEIRNVLKATGASRSDTDTLDIVFGNTARLRSDPVVKF